MFVKHTISQLYQILRTMKLACKSQHGRDCLRLLYYGSVLVPHWYVFFIYHTFICKIYNSMWIMHTLICKFSTLVCKIYSIICKIHTLIRKIHTFTWKLVWYIKIKSVNLAPIRVRTIQTLIYSYLELQLFFF